MGKIKITIETDGAAFDDGMQGSTEVSRILRGLSNDVFNDESLEERYLKDLNGNTVGKVEVDD